jgi:hypothetical protein
MHHSVGRNKHRWLSKGRRRRPERHVVAGSSQEAIQTHVDAGSSKVPMATLPLDDD